MDGFSQKVRGVLSDTMNLPNDFLSMIPQYVAQNPVSLARTAGDRITSGKQTNTITTVGITFAAGADILTNVLTFTADGKTDYVVKVFAPFWENDTAGAENFLHLNLDGADGGFMAAGHLEGASHVEPLSGVGYMITPVAGSHTVNARLVVSSGTGTIGGGSGGVGANLPILVTLEVA